MAHPLVDKLQTFALRHGEKVGVAVVSAICLAMLGAALSRPSVDITKEQIASATQRAQQNLNNQQKPETIEAKIRDAGVVQPNFIALVEGRENRVVDASPYALPNTLAAPEPGAGLLRDTPELVRIQRVLAHAGRGSIRIYDTNPETGEIVYEVPKPEAPKPSRSRRNRNAGGSGGMMAAMMGGSGGTRASQGGDLAKAEAEKKRRQDEERARRAVAGDVVPGDPKAEEKSDPSRPPGAEPREVLRGFRWAVVTGIIDNKKLRDNLARATKVDPAAAFVNYLRVDLERQERRDDGSWSAWTPVDRKFSQENVLELLTDIESETGPTGTPITPEDVRLKTLVDPLPFLEAGYWFGVHHGEVVDAKALETTKPEETAAAGPMGRGSGGMMSGGMLGGRGGSSGMTSASSMEAMMMRQAAGSGMSGTPRGATGSGGMSGGMASGRGMSMGDGGMGAFGSMFRGGGGSGSPADVNFEKSEAPKLMVRALDFTVQPDRVYRYRARLVIRNPNYNNPNVMPGVDNGSEELLGEWSEPTETVSIPPDVETYVVGLPPADARGKRADSLAFSVVRWDQNSGVTIVKPFYEAPGDVVGQPDGAYVPAEEKDKTRLVRKTIDFTSQRLLVDMAGEMISLDRLGVGPSTFASPARAVLLRPDGRLVVRDDAGDLVAGDLAEMTEIYRQTQKDAEDESGKKTSNFFGSGGMMGGGMMGGGMMGRGR
jgi:hypothetical protein